MAASPETHLSSAAGRAVAGDLFVLGFPLVLMDAVRRAHPLASSRFHRLAPDPGNLARGLAEHDSRTVQSSAAIDVAAGPAILHLPDVRGRYYSLTLLDSTGEPFAGLGSRTRDPGSSDIVLVGPNWRGEIKRGFRARRTPCDAVWAVSRILANSMADIPVVEELAAHQCVVPLLAPGEARMPAGLPSLDVGEMPLDQQVAELAPEIYCHRLGLLLARAPAAVREAISVDVVSRLQALGVPAASEAWPDELRAATTRGFADGMAAIVAAGGGNETADASGWSAPGIGDDGTPLGRAARIYAHLGAPLAEDILTLSCAKDESGRQLTGEERYRIHFPVGGLPPAEALWRLAALPLDREEQLGAASGTISDRSELHFNRGGSLELIIQPQPQQADFASNWLQSPAGPFRLIARLYWPAPAALSGAWRMPPVERLGSRFARRISGRILSRGRPKASFGPRTLGPRSALKESTMRRLCLASLFAAAAALATPVVAQPAMPKQKLPSAQSANAPAVDPEAVAALKRMSDYLATLKAFEIKADTSLDLVLDDGEKVQLDGVTTYKVRRPNAFVIENATKRKVRRFIYDGRRFTLYSPNLGYYAQADAPPTIRQALEAIHDRYDIELPLEDLFTWSDPASRQGDPLKSAMVVGDAVIDGVDTTQYAFRQGDTDWQLWIQKGDQPIPRKLVIVSRTDEARPAYTARLGWNTRASLDDKTFAFVPDANAKPIRFAETTQ